MDPTMTPPFVGSMAGNVKGLKSKITAALVVVGAGPLRLAAVAWPVRLEKPDPAPKPMAKVSVELVVCRAMPPEMALPEPVLFVTAGTTLAGLRPFGARL